jgi:hypothetical protein
MSAIGVKRTWLFALQCPLLTQSGHGASEILLLQTNPKCTGTKASIIPFIPDGVGSAAALTC